MKFKPLSKDTIKTQEVSAVPNKAYNRIMFNYNKAYCADLQDDRGREQSQTPVLVVLVFGAVPVLPSTSVHSELCTQQTLQCHSNPETKKSRANYTSQN